MVSALDPGGTPQNKSDDTWRSWGVSDGLVDSYTNAIDVNSLGHVWVGTSGGLARMVTGLDESVYLPVLTSGP